MEVKGIFKKDENLSQHNKIPNNHNPLKLKLKLNKIILINIF